MASRVFTMARSGSGSSLGCVVINHQLIRVVGWSAAKSSPRTAFRLSRLNQDALKSPMDKGLGMRIRQQ